MRFATKLASSAAVLIFLSACKKDNKIVPVTPLPVEQGAAVIFDYTAMVNNRLMSPDTAWYSDAVGDSFTVTKFDYYITNIKLIRDDGFVYAEPESYRIVRHVDKQTMFQVRGVPDGNYTGVEFLIGVDSLRNTSGAQTGALDESQGMYWDWQTGYIFFKLEGDFKTRTFTVPSEYALHIGTSPNAQKCSFSFAATPVTAKKGRQSFIHYLVNIDQVFSNPTHLDMNTYHAVSGGPLAAKVAGNYKNMFSISGVDNQ